MPQELANDKDNRKTGRTLLNLMTLKKRQKFISIISNNIIFFWGETLLIIEHPFQGTRDLCNYNGELGIGRKVGRL